MNWSKQFLGLKFGAMLKAFSGMLFGIKIHSRYRFECREYAGGPLLWVAFIKNLTTTQGLNDNLTKYLKGASYTAAWYVGLVDNASFSAFAAGDTAAQIGGSNGWLESTAYSESVRQTLTLGSASAGSIDNTGSPAVFTMNTSGTLNGGFLVSSSTKGGTSGVLFSEGAFGGGNQPFANGNVITVTVTSTAASA